MIFPCSRLNYLVLPSCLTEELQKQLAEQVELRKKLEREFQHLKGRTKICLYDVSCVRTLMLGVEQVVLSNKYRNVSSIQLIIFASDVAFRTLQIIFRIK